MKIECSAMKGTKQCLKGEFLCDDDNHCNKMCKDQHCGWIPGCAESHKDVLAIDPYMCKLCNTIYCEVCIRENNSTTKACEHCFTNTQMDSIKFYKERIYKNTVVSCPYDDCNGKFKLKDDSNHFRFKCSHFRYYQCKATICKIRQNKDCECELCRYHDCYGMSKQNLNDNEDINADVEEVKGAAI